MDISHMIPRVNPRAAGVLLLLAVLPLPAVHAQIGNDNPTGPAGMFNPPVLTAGRYDSYTGNAVRQVTDLTVAGAVGAYPLAFTRFCNSRGNLPYWVRFGSAATWQHSYDWRMTDSQPSSSPTPPSYEVLFPDGRDENFTSTGARSVPALREQVKPLNLTTMLVYLVLPDGGTVEFKATQSFNNGRYSYTYVAQAITDPYGQRTTFTYTTGNLYQVTEPAGRWIRLFYVTVPWYNGGFVQETVIDHITASDGRTVQYSYASITPGNLAYTALTGATYFGNTNIRAAYTYQPPNVNSADGVPLLSTCDDPMYAGAMKKIGYSYVDNSMTSTIPFATGQVYSESNGTSGTAVSQLSVPSSYGSRTEVRGDGYSRSFGYSSQYFQSGSDFNSIYDNVGRDPSSFFINSYTDRNTNIRSMNRDSVTGNPLDVTYPATPSDTAQGTPAGAVHFVYGSATCPDANNKDFHYLYSAQDEAGNTTVYLRDTNKRVSRINYPDGEYETFGYNTFGELTTHRLRTGGSETFSYDNRGLKTQYRDPYHASGNPSARYQYNGLDRLIGVTDALGTSSGDVNHTTSYAYNDRVQVTLITHPTDPVDSVRHTVSNVIDDNTGTLTSVTDELGHTTSYTYDDYRRVRSMTTPGHNTPVTTNYFYDSTGTGDDYRLTTATVTFVKAPGGEVTKIDYDKNLRKLHVTSGYNTIDAATFDYGYDSDGNLTTITDPKNHNTTILYDQRNRPYQVTDQASHSTSCMYDGGGRKASITRANNQVTTFDSYDSMNRLLQQTVQQSPNPSAVTHYGYDPAGGLLQTMQDPNGNVYTYDYDQLNRKTSLAYPDGSTESWTFENTGTGTRAGDGLLYQFKNRAGKLQTFTYDALNRQTLSNWNDTVTPDVTTKYDVASRITKIINSNATVVRSYYNDNLLNTETSTYGDNIARKLTYTYDADGRRASLQYPNNAYTFDYGYTARHQLNAVTNDVTAAVVASYVYDVNGNMTSRTLPGNSTSSSYGYNAVNLCTSISHAFAATSAAPATRTFGYGYNNVNDRKWVQRDSGNGDVFGYDQADQVDAVKLDIASPSGTSAGPQTIVYDGSGNRTSFAAYGITDTYPPANSLNQYPTRNTSQAQYDTNGNMMTGFDGSTYTYDAQNRLLSAKKGANGFTFAYDGSTGR